MKCASFFCLFPFLTTALLFSQSNPESLRSSSSASPVANVQPDSKAQAAIRTSYGQLPLSFEANHAQTDAQVKFLSRTSGYTLFLTSDEAVLALRATARNAVSRSATIKSSVETRIAASSADTTTPVLRMKLHNANPAAKITGENELTSKSNYFIGNDPNHWQTNVPTYARVKYEQIYPGIDLIYYGNQRQLEYDFIVSPRANHHRIAFEVCGAKRIRQNAQGELVFAVGEDEIRWHKPVVYQEKNGARRQIAARYSITGTNQVGFEIAKYDADRPLYIDPLIYSTYLGGNNDDLGLGIATDNTGNIYVTGYTQSANFSVSPGAYQSVCNDGRVECGDGAIGDVFVTKISPSGSLLYSTYLGGSGTDWGYGIAIDKEGDAYVTGWTTSSDFPLSSGAFGTVYCKSQSGNCTAGTAFITKLNPTGSALVYSTYLSGSWWVQANGIAVDSAGDAYVTGTTQAPDFPTTPGAFQTVCGAGDDCIYYYDAFVSKINRDGTALVYSTFLGGQGFEYGQSIAVDSAGNAYVTGRTGSTNFPTTPGTLQPICPDQGQGCGGGFVTKFNSTGSALIYSTFLNGTPSGTCCVPRPFGIAVDDSGNTYLTGLASPQFPVTPGAFETTGGGGFVAKFNSAGSAFVYSTFLNDSSPAAIAIDTTGHAYITGNVGSVHFPTLSSLQKCNGGRRCSHFGDAFVTKFNPTASALVYSTFLGGSSYDVGNSIAVDGAGNAYVTGRTFSSDFPTMDPGQSSSGGADDAFVTKLFIAAVTTTTLSSAPNPSIKGQAVTFTANVTSNDGAPADGETVSFIKGKTLLGTGILAGGTATFTTSALKVGTASVKAVYDGDTNFAASTSKPVKQVVKKAD